MENKIKESQGLCDKFRSYLMTRPSYIHHLRDAGLISLQVDVFELRDRALQDLAPL